MEGSRGCAHVFTDHRLRLRLVNLVSSVTAEPLAMSSLVSSSLLYDSDDESVEAADESDGVPRQPSDDIVDSDSSAVSFVSFIHHTRDWSKEHPPRSVSWEWREDRHGFLKI